MKSKKKLILKISCVFFNHRIHNTKINSSDIALNKKLHETISVYSFSPNPLRIRFDKMDG